MMNIERQHPKPSWQAGFTLLEVLVALTIAGMALGALIAVIGGNKQLAWRTEAALVETARLRSHINLAQLNNGRTEVRVDFIEQRYVLHDEMPVPVPQRKTQGSIHALRAYEIRGSNSEALVKGTYWVELPLPE
jgi:prepilin-type N-terminal cleavage/methylation domain-containing protein